MPTAKYEEISGILESEIATADVALGSKFLSDNEIASRFSVAPMTARQAMSCLLAKGLIVRRRGSGTFVKAKPALNPPRRVTLLFAGEWATDAQRTPFWQRVAETIAGIVDEMAKAGIPLHIVPCDADADWKLDVNIADVVEQDEAVAVLALPLPVEIAKALLRKRCGIAAIGNRPIPSELTDSVTSVDYDRPDALRQVARHLIEQGCKNIVSTDFSTGIRADDFNNAFRAERWPGRILHKNGAASAETAQTLVKGLLKAGDLGDALFFWNRPAALGGLRALRSAGIRVPKDVCVVAMQGAEGPILSDEPITTVMTESKEVGRAAAQELIRYVVSKQWKPALRLVKARLAITVTSVRRK